MIGRLHTVALDSPDPGALAAFYGAVLGLPVTQTDSEWWILGERSAPPMSFQLAPNHIAPRWPDPQAPQQAHVDISVEDIDIAHPAVLELGATLLDDSPRGFRVYADPHGHPFCFVYDEPGEQP